MKHEIGIIHYDADMKRIKIGGKISEQLDFDDSF